MPVKINLKDKVEDGEIDLSMSGLQDVPVKEIAQLTKVHSLDLSNNHLVGLPKNFVVLTNLIKLDLSKNSLKELPEDFGNLVKLKYLDLYRNELQHLPLSFSKLKALRWLDLKDNPLVPAIKEAAGLCLDSKQCQSCARDIVMFYTNLQEQVIKEREMREKQRQKDRLANEIANQKIKQDKKQKKKEKSKKVETTKDEISKKEIITKVSTKPELISKTTGIIPQTLLNLLFFIIFMISTIFILTSIKFKYTKVFENETKALWQNYLDNVPPYLGEKSAIIGFYFENLHNLTGKFILEIHSQLTLLSENPHVKNLYESVYNGFNVTVYYVKQYCNSVFSRS